MRLFFTNDTSFRVALAIFLSLVDIAISVILWKFGKSLSALAYQIIPISIFISGNHQQFDNFAILIMLFAVYRMRSSGNSVMLDSKDKSIVLLIGLSLAVKHVFFLFPFWFAFKKWNLRKKLFYIIAPYLFFLFSFLPFASKGLSNIVNSVLLYKSTNFSPLFNFLKFTVHLNLTSHQLRMLIFILIMLSLGFMARSLPLFKAFALYLIATIVFTPSMANQYLVIPLIGVLVFFNIFYFLWLLTASLFLLPKDSASSPVRFFADLFPQDVSGFNYLFILMLCGFTYSLCQVLFSNSQAKDK